MHVRLTALAVCVAAICAALPAMAADPVVPGSISPSTPGASPPGFLQTDAAGTLTLDDAFRRVAAKHPDLRLFGPRSDVLAAERDRASLRPA